MIEAQKHCAQSSANTLVVLCTVPFPLMIYTVLKSLALCQACRALLWGGGEAAWSHVPSAHRGAGPLEGVAREEHVPDQGLDGRLADQPDKEQLLYHWGGDSPEGGQPQQKLAEPGGLVGILRPTVLLQGTLGLFLKLLDHWRGRQSDSVWKENETVRGLAE